MSDLHKSIRVIGCSGNHKLDELVLGHVNALTQSKLDFSHFSPGHHIDGEDNVKLNKPEKMKDQHLILMQCMRHNHIPGQLLADQFLTFAWEAREHGAKSITAVVSFLLYRRQDNPRGNEIARTKMMIERIANAGVNNLILIDIHSPKTLKFCEEVGLKAWNIEPDMVYAEVLDYQVRIAQKHDIPYYIYAPDLGSVPRAVALARALRLRGLKVKIAVTPKHRDPISGEVTILEGEEFLEELNATYSDVEIERAGENLKGAHVCTRDDEAASCNTGVKTARKLKENGVAKLTFIATHPVLTPGWRETLVETPDPPFDYIYMSNSIDRDYDKATGGHIIVVDLSKIIADRLVRTIIGLNGV